MGKGGKRRRWSDEEKRSICHQVSAPGVSVAQVARRYAMNANMIFGWLKDPKFNSEPPDTEFLPVEVGPTQSNLVVTIEPAAVLPAPAPAPVGDGRIEIVLADGHRVKAEGAFDPDALAKLLKGLMT